MLRIHLHDGTVHSIPLIERSAAGLAEQLAVLFASGGNVLSMRVDGAPQSSEAPKTKAKGAKKS